MNGQSARTYGSVPGPVRTTGEEPPAALARPPRHSHRRTTRDVARLVCLVLPSAVLSLGLAGGAFGGSAGASARPATAHVAQVTVHDDAVSLFVGTWLGPFPGPAGDCGEGYSEWFMYATGSYTSTWNSENCGGTTSYGRYVVRGRLLLFEQEGDPGCPTCVQRQTIPVRYRFLTANALRLCDYPAGLCYIYYRQR
jgi:hypothetical protein